MTWDSHTDRRLKKLHPFVQKDVETFIDRCEAQLGVQLRITAGLRTFDEQDALYDQGRSTSGKKVTNAKGGESYHNYGLAFDVVEIRGGQAVWETEHWDAIGALGEECGFEWGGRWDSFPDRPHFQKTFGYTTAQLKGLVDSGALVVV